MKVLVLILIPVIALASSWHLPTPCEAIAHDRIAFIGTVQSSRAGSTVVQVEQGGPLPQGTILDMVSLRPIETGRWFMMASKGVAEWRLVFPEVRDRYLLEDAQPVRWEHRAFFKALRNHSAGATLTIHLMTETDRQVILEIDSGEHRYSAIVDSGRAEFRHIEPGDYRINLAPDPLYEIDKSHP